MSASTNVHYRPYSPRPPLPRRETTPAERAEVLQRALLAGLVATLRVLLASRPDATFAPCEPSFPPALQAVFGCDLAYVVRAERRSGAWTVLFAPAMRADADGPLVILDRYEVAVEDVDASLLSFVVAEVKTLLKVTRDHSRVGAT